MSEASVPKFDVGGRVEAGLSLMAILAGVTAAYYTGQTGEPHPLFFVCAGLALFVLFFTAEK